MGEVDPAIRSSRGHVGIKTAWSGAVAERPDNRDFIHIRPIAAHPIGAAQMHPYYQDVSRTFRVISAEAPDLFVCLFADNKACRFEGVWREESN
jgi:hypothetical protein